MNRIDFLHNTQFSYDEMRAFLPIDDGGIFDTSAVQHGIEIMRKAYGARGFANFSSLPTLVIDDSRNSVTLTLDLEEGAQFRLGHVKVLGIDPGLAQKLLHESGLEPKIVYDPSLVDGFFRRNRQILPSDASPMEDTQRFMDERTATVDITMDFRRCPYFAGR